MINRGTEFLAAFLVCTSFYVLSDWAIYSLENQTLRLTAAERLFYSHMLTAMCFSLYLCWRLKDWVFSEDKNVRWNFGQYWCLWIATWCVGALPWITGYVLQLATLPAHLFVASVAPMYPEWLGENWGEFAYVVADPESLIRPVSIVCASTALAFGDKIKTWSAALL